MTMMIASTNHSNRHSTSPPRSTHLHTFDDHLGAEITIPSGAVFPVMPSPSVAQNGKPGNHAKRTTDHSSCTNSMSSSQQQRKKEWKKNNMSTALRARNHLKHHGETNFGRKFDFYPKSITFNEARTLVGTAYADGHHAAVQWMSSPMDVSQDEAQKVFRCLVSHPINDMLTSGGGILFGIRHTGKDNAGSNTLKACAIFREVNPHKEGKSGLLRQVIGLVSHTCAYLDKKSSSASQLITSREHRAKLGRTMARATLIEQEMARYHATYGPSNENHWYLSDVVVDPEFQGQGYGRELLVTLCKLADRYSMAMYLECPLAGPVKFFQKCGFSIQAKESIKLPSNAAEEDDDQLFIAIMIRKPMRNV